MSRPLRIAIVGCGMMGQAHARAWSARDDARVVMACDTEPAASEKLAADCGASPHTAWEAAVADASIDVVSVCTPVCWHPPVAVAAIRAGKHVLCEKPMALTLDDADQMIAAADAAGVHLHVSYQYRGRPRYQQYRRWVEDGTLAGPILARFVDLREVRPKLAMHRRGLNGGPIIDMTGHFFDMMRYLTGREPRTVFATGHVFGAGKPRLAEIQDPAIDAAEIQVRYDGRHVASVLVHWGLPEGSATITDEMISSAGAVARFQDDRLTLGDAAGPREVALPEDVFDPVISVERLVAALDGRAVAGGTARDGRIALATSLAALRSMETGVAEAVDA